MKNFINPKKIKGQDQLNRIKDLMGKMGTLNESKSFAELELIKKGPNNIVYGIVRENHDYFIKTCEKKSGEFLSEDFQYIGGDKNKFDERYKSYAEAIKHLNMKFDMLNESFGIEKNNSIFESDGVPTGNASGGVAGTGFGFVMNEKEEDAIEEKTVLNVEVPKQEAPVEDEIEVDEFSAEEGGDEFGDETEEVEVDAEIGDEEEGDDYTKKIQKLTGKVTQMMRDMDEPDSELDKYVINSVISAIDWDEVDDEDVEDIIAKIEGEDEEDEEGVEVSDDFGDETEEVEVDAEEELDEPAIAESEESEGEKEEKEGDEDEDEGDEVVDDEDKEEREKHYEGDVKDIEDQIEKLKKDLTRAKKKKEEYKNESKTFSKKQLMESILKKKSKNILNKVLTENQRICEECFGEGCGVCEGVTDLDLVSGNDVRGLEEMDVATAVATGQDYLHATGDLDRDGDQIPNRLDRDSNADGSIDHGMGNKMYDWPEHILGRKGDRDSDGIPNKYDDDVDGDLFGDDDPKQQPKT